MNAKQYLAHCQAKRQAATNRRRYRFQIASAIALSVLYVASLFTAILACAYGDVSLACVTIFGAGVIFAAFQFRPIR